MKTNIRFPSHYEDIEQEVVGLIEKMLGAQALESDIMDATTAVSRAFHEADCLSGNGMDHIGTHTVREFYAVANINTGDFNLYREIK